jgi:hypothetical protein
MNPSLPDYCNPMTAKVIHVGDPACDHNFTETEESELVFWDCPLCGKKMSCEVYE